LFQKQRWFSLQNSCYNFKWLSREVNVITEAAFSLRVTLMSNKKIYRPGQIAPRSAQYGVVGPRGGKTGFEITGVKGKPLPPTDKPRMGYKLDDPTRHKTGR